MFDMIKSAFSLAKLSPLKLGIIAGIIGLISLMWWQAKAAFDDHNKAQRNLGRLEERAKWQDKYAADMSVAIAGITAAQEKAKAKARADRDKAKKRQRESTQSISNLVKKLQEARDAAKNSNCTNHGADYKRLRNEAQCRLNTIYTKSTGLHVAECRP